MTKRVWLCDHVRYLILRLNLSRHGKLQARTWLAAWGFTRIGSLGWEPGGDQNERTRKRYRAEFNPAAYMLALEKMVLDAGVKLLYDTRFCSVRLEGARISHILIENKSGRSALACRSVVDSTGDADLCFAAGEETFSVDSNVLAGWFYTFMAAELQLHPWSNAYSPGADTLGAQGPFFRGDDAEQVTDHILQTRELIRERLSHLRAQKPTQDPQLLMPATTACLRMTRRLAGRFTLAEKHLHQWFEDAIGLAGDWRRPGPVYAIPFRCLQGLKTSNLLVAGRCISVDNTAWDALRAIPPCVVTGEAAGTAAALAAREVGGDIDALDVGALQEQLLRQGVLLDPALVSRSGKNAESDQGKSEAGIGKGA